MNQHFCFILVALIFINFPNSFSQNTDWFYLSKAKTILTIVEDGDYIWVGSHIGATKIDKNTSAKIYYDKTNSPIPDSWISKIVIDKNGTKWLGTWQKGNLLKFDDVNWTIYDTSNSPLNGSAIKNLAIDSSNNIWISTTNTNSGLYKFDGTNWTHYNTLNSGIPSDVISFVFCEENIVWISTNVGLSKFDGINWTNYNSINSNISNSSIYDIDKDGNGNLWILHTNGLEKFDGNTFTVFNNSNTNIPNINNNSMAIDTNNIIWTGCSSYLPNITGGVMSFNGSSWTKYDTTNSYVTDIDVGSLYVDKSNNVWFGLNNIGMVGRKEGINWSNYNPSKSELGNSVIRQTVFGQNGTTFIGTEDTYISGKGLTKFDWINWTELSNYNNYSWSMTTNQLGDLYVKNQLDLKKFNGVNWTIIPNTPDMQTHSFNINLNCLITDSIGGIWMDYFAGVNSIYDSIYGWINYPNEGLAYFNGSSWATFNNSNSPIINTNIYEIKVGANNHIWLGTDKGLLEYDGSNWTTYSVSNSSIPTNYIYSFSVDSDDNIWFPAGTYGLCKFDRINTTYFQHPISNSYLSGGVISSDIDGSIWIYTLFNVINFDGIYWTSYNADNSPIPNSSNIKSLSIDKFGNKWIGTQFGLLVYNQGGVILSTNSLPVKLSSISIYPNPTSNNLSIDTELEISEITIIDITGKIIMKTRQNINDVSVADLSNGIYFIKLITNEKTITQKFVKQ